MKYISILLLSRLIACGGKTLVTPYSGTWTLTTIGGGTDVGTASFTKDSMYITQDNALYPCGFSKDKDNITVTTPTIGALFFTETTVKSNEIIWTGKAGTPFTTWKLTR